MVYISGSGEILLEPISVDAHAMQSQQHLLARKAEKEFLSNEEDYLETGIGNDNEDWGIW